MVGERTLLDGLYLFTIYALRFLIAFRNLLSYLGIAISKDLGFTDFALSLPIYCYIGAQYVYASCQCYYLTSE